MKQNKQSDNIIQNNTDYVLEMLKDILFFKKTSKETLNEVLKLLKVVRLNAGDPVFLENEISNRIYFALEGSVEIVSYKVKLRQVIRIKIFKPGEHFSELSVLTKSNHSTSCFALENTILLTLDQQSFRKLLSDHPDIASELVHILAKLNLQLTDSSNYIEYYKEENFEFDRSMIQILPIEFIKRFHVLPIRLFGGGLEIAIKDPHNIRFFKGFKALNKNLSLKINVINDKDYNHLYNRVIALYGRKDDHLDITAQEAPIEGETSLLKLLKYSLIFSRLEDAILEMVVPYFKKEIFPEGFIIFEADNESKKFYIIQNGQVELNKIQPHGRNTVVATLNSKDSFSEISLLTNTKHSLQARATKETIIHYLDKSVFTNLLDSPLFSIPLAEVLAKRLQDLNKQMQVQIHTGELVFNDKILGKLIPRELMLQYKIIPIKLENKELTLGVVNPDDDGIFIVISRHLPLYRINIMLIGDATFRNALNITSDKSTIHMAEEEHSERELFQFDLSTPENFIKELVLASVMHRASDIHIEPTTDNYVVRLRVDGELFELHKRVDKEFAPRVINKIKIDSGMDITERRLPQDGQFKSEIKEDIFQARVSTVPAKIGEKVVMRIVSSKSSVLPINMIAPDKDAIMFLKKISKFRQGVFLVTGPTGSGKTTSLYSILNEMNSIKKNIITVEDPVELFIPGITQIEVNEEIDLSFDIILRNILRQDPDIIMVGEIRDSKSAQLAFEAALTGHLVLSTLHTNNSIDIITRLRELEVSNSSIATGLLGVMSQRLIPSLCPECKVRRKVTLAEKDSFRSHIEEDSIPEYMFDSFGCKKCFMTGIYDRIPIFEYWIKDREIRETILNHKGEENLLKIINKKNFRNLHSFGIHMVKNGITTMKHVEDHLYGT
ncbi:MAG: Flp pilus assembly complex ATPase component [Deltaproteobacteria bacterium]|nr:Flp pilus assembly complex ATPase component [Deltaproteobacteria bacterium]